jgi:hypothetical protein
MNALSYARERVQGRNLLQMRDKSAPAVPIIQHPEVRQQLMTMKCYVEGLRSLIYYTAHCQDRHNIAEDPEKKARFQGLVDLLIPVVKGYVTDRAFEVCSIGLQVYGGYGYIKEYPQEQLLRDCRITMIYEGTNGIQAMDLLGRKLGMNQGKPVMDFIGQIQKSIARAKAVEEIKPLAEELEKAINKLAEVGMHMGATAMSPKVLNAFSFASLFLEVVGDVGVAWMLLWRAAVAEEKMAGKVKKKDLAFYEGQIKSAQYFIQTVLPVTHGKMAAILGGCNAVVDISDDAFGGK